MTAENRLINYSYVLKARKGAKAPVLRAKANRGLNARPLVPVNPHCSGIHSREM